MTDIIEKDVQDFINEARNFSDKMLTEEGEFLPFGFQIDNNGKLTYVGVDEGDNEIQSKYIIDTLDNSLGKDLEDGLIRSYCIAFDTRLQNNLYPDKIDALILHIKHKDKTELIRFFFPYEIVNPGEIKYHDGWYETN